MNTVNYKDANEVLKINRYHLLLVFERLEKQKSRFPSFEHAMIPFSMLISTLITLLTADFKDSFGFNADVWQMFILCLMIVSALTTTVFLGLYVKNRGWSKPKTPDKIVQGIIEEMEHQQKR